MAEMKFFSFKTSPTLAAQSGPWCFPASPHKADAIAEQFV